MHHGPDIASKAEARSPASFGNVEPEKSTKIEWFRENLRLAQCEATTRLPTNPISVAQVGEVGVAHKKVGLIRDTVPVRDEHLNVVHTRRSVYVSVKCTNNSLMND